MAFTTSLSNIIVCKNAGPKLWPLPPALATSCAKNVGPKPFPLPALATSSCAKMLGQNHFVACWIYFQQLYIHI
jgi:hypothetical protein